MELGQEDVKKTLLKLGMKGIDAEHLIKSAEKNRSSVSWQFFKSMLGLYTATFWTMAVCFIFILGMNRKEFVAFTAMYFAVILVILFCTPMWKLLVFSIKVFLSLKGR